MTLCDICGKVDTDNVVEGPEMDLYECDECIRKYGKKFQ
jgi:translation initiation factor 2 beta subunit (eIF-2beta)/eIF-5